ncbi:hypothetical protein NEH83_01490 [Streptomyces sp. JUS-F4]|uniref:hypothetical protein n=1 Tax=Streptomyces sp. JUS-F4 TaxID=2951988 RepID=UPI0026662464|nr:hypothetical protein [Streptomyces sp. JUS-F4]WKN12988.1 hypothetical protein NEH83_01490 [Streptomyces sp. JUS-F4]
MPKWRPHSRVADLEAGPLTVSRVPRSAGCPDPVATRHLDAVLDALPEDVLRPAWEHMSLRMADWAIRHFAPSDMEHWLDRAEQRLD